MRARERACSALLVTDSAHGPLRWVRRYSFYVMYFYYMIESYVKITTFSTTDFFGEPDAPQRRALRTYVHAI